MAAEPATGADVADVARAAGTPAIASGPARAGVTVRRTMAEVGR
jgi:hypothetical protein